MKIRIRLLAQTILAVTLYSGFSGAPSHGQSSPSLEAKWGRLSPEQRIVVKQRFETWKRLPPERREELSRRYAQLESVKEEALVSGGDEGMNAPDGSATTAPPDPVTDGLVRRFLKQRRKEILGNPGLTPEQIEELPPNEMERLARERAQERLADLVARGVVDRTRADELAKLPTPRLARELRMLNKQAILRDPPQEFRDLPEAERARIRALPPDAFLREIKRLVPRPNAQRQPGVFEGIVPKAEKLTPSQEGERRAPPRNPRLAAVKKWLEDHLTPEERLEIKSADPIERRQVVLRLLKARARAAFEARGEDARHVDEVDLLPKHERDARLIQLIDREFDPGAPEPADGDPPGQGSRKPKSHKNF